MDDKFVEDLFQKIASKHASPKSQSPPAKLPPKQASALAKQFLQEYLQQPKESVEAATSAVETSAKAPSPVKKAKPVKLILKKKVREAKDGKDGKDGRTPEFAVREESLMWKYQDEDDSSWVKLFDMSDLQRNGSSFADGLGGGGGGRRIVTEFKEEGGVVYYKASDEDDDDWMPLFELPSGEITTPQYKVEGYDVYWRASDDEEWVLMYTVPVAPTELVAFTFDGGFPDTDYTTASPAFSCGGVI